MDDHVVLLSLLRGCVIPQAVVSQHFAIVLEELAKCILLLIGAKRLHGCSLSLRCWVSDGVITGMYLAHSCVRVLWKHLWLIGSHTKFFGHVIACESITVDNVEGTAIECNIHANVEVFRLVRVVRVGTGLGDLVSLEKCSLCNTTVLNLLLNNLHW